MTEENFEKFLKKTAQGYNAPPVRVPREEMWAAIQAKRAAGPRVVYGGGSASPAPVRRFGSKVWLGAAAAAMLLVATGVGIGRWTASGPTPRMAASRNDLPVPGVTISGGQATAPGTSSPAPASTSTSNPEPNRNVATGRNQTRAGGSNVASNPTTNPDRAQPARLTPSPTSAYQLTAMQNLSEAEALLTSFRSRSSADQQMDAQLGTWARQLLTNTRLLLDSPVGDDPQRRPLLQDLELVLVQIVQQLSPGSTPQDRELIEKTMQDNHVMTRLRTAIPAGAQRGS
ncbi:MAG TPA: hypothetical protein VFP26_05810 [Gemmatimonadaceae bacterium]|jgi:hypothetical protein|nr:hypothetical protein [Gemmatimonadaceae bacterium]